MATPSDVIHTLRVRHRGEVVSHGIVRAAFLHDIIVDERTKLLFAVWRERFRFDGLIAGAQLMLDRAAETSGFDSRAVFRSRIDGTERSLLDAIRDPGEQELLAQLLEHLDHRLTDTRRARLYDAPRFIVGELYRTADDPETPVAIREWLGNDLIAVFDEDIACRVWGTRLELQVPLSPIIGDVPTGRRPRHDGEQLVRDAHWYYLAEIHEPRVSLRQLARDEFVDGGRKKDVKDGIARAKYLLTLPVPPELWAEITNPPGGNSRHA